MYTKELLHDFRHAVLILVFPSGVSSSCHGSWFASSHDVVALEETSLLLEGPGPFALVGDSGAGKRSENLNTTAFPFSVAVLYMTYQGLIRTGGETVGEAMHTLGNTVIGVDHARFIY